MSDQKWDWNPWTSNVYDAELRAYKEGEKEGHFDEAWNAKIQLRARFAKFGLIIWGVVVTT